MKKFKEPRLGTLQQNSYNAAAPHVEPEYRIVSATGTYAASGTLAVSANWAAAIATYKIAAPSVVSIVRASSSPTNAASVDFTVTFSAVVFGVDGPGKSLNKLKKKK